MFDLRRRQVIALLSGAGVTWSFAVHAQLGERKRRIGVLSEFAADDRANGPRLSIFRQALEQLGWSENRNVLIDYRFAGGSSDRYLPLAQELIALRSDVIVASGTPITVTLQRETQAIPIVFIGVSDPTGAGLIASLARPGGNITGVLNYEAGIIGKWLALLKEIAPRVTRAALDILQRHPISVAKGDIADIDRRPFAADGDAFEPKPTSADRSRRHERLLGECQLAPHQHRRVEARGGVIGNRHDQALTLRRTPVP
jgi:ABC transporter substrate binding protein